MGKLGIFLAGAAAGAVALGVTACLVDKYGNSSGSSYDDDDDNDGIEKNCAAENTAEETQDTQGAKLESRTAEQNSKDTTAGKNETLAKLIEILAKAVLASKDPQPFPHYPHPNI